MAVLGKDDFFTAVQTRIGSDTSDEAIAFVENMTDTYNDLLTKANGDGTDWEQKYRDLDESWKARYKHRFFSSPAMCNPDCDPAASADPGEDPTNISIDDLFKQGDQHA